MTVTRKSKKTIQLKNWMFTPGEKKPLWLKNALDPYKRIYDLEKEVHQLKDKTLKLKLRLTAEGFK